MHVIGFARRTALAAIAASSLTAGTAFAETAANPGDVFTAVVSAPIGQQHTAVTGTDGMAHVVYEVVLTNTKPATATLQGVDIINAEDPAQVIVSWTGSDLLDHLRTMKPAPAEDATIPFNESRLLYVQLALEPGKVPSRLAHRFHLLAAPNPGPSAEAAPMEYTGAAIDVSEAPLLVLPPPLRGDGWVAFNGCCNDDIVHRGSLQGVNGGLYDAQRFAIDWMRLNADGELVHGDPADVRNFVDYGAEVHAVADATVIDALDGLNDQAPGTLPDPATISINTVDGNHIILDLGDGYYAFYAHLQNGSVRVKTGDQVKTGDVMALLGNTGNTSGPHLHFHIMDGPSALGSQGLPYVIDQFSLTGQVDPARFAESDDLDGKWADMPGEAVAEQNRFPLNLNIVDFGER